jgi:hypothetical protein
VPHFHKIEIFDNMRLNNKRVTSPALSSDPEEDAEVQETPLVSGPEDANESSGLNP